MSQMSFETLSNDDVDSRVPVVDNGPAKLAIGRIRGDGIEDDGKCATAFLITGGLMLTAGHIGAQSDTSSGTKPHTYYRLGTVEFDVPPSTDKGFPVDANPQNVFKVKRKTTNDGVTLKDNDNPYTLYISKNQTFHRQKDWCVFKLERNMVSGLTAIESQKCFFRLSEDYNFNDPKQSAMLSLVSGYGRYPTPPKTPIEFFPRWSTLQYAEGHITAEVNPSPDISDRFNLLHYDISTFKGNSGSPLYLKESHLVVGIHIGINPNDAHQGEACGTKSIDLVQQIKKMLGVDWIVDPNHPSVMEKGTILAPFKSLQTALEISLGGESIGIAGPCSCVYIDKIVFQAATTIKVLGAGQVFIIPGVNLKKK